MDGATITLQRADDSELAYVETVLERNELPSQDVRSNPGSFYIGYDGAETVGVGGLESYGSDGLLRSVVVERSARGNGFGVALCETLEARASTDGVERLHLLTTTASGFFARLGYEEIERVDAPDAIRRTTQFADLCPETATCMRKLL